jgi:rhodanese-related sulfurtransferase
MNWLDLQQKNPGVKLIDVRSREEYEAVHIDGRGVVVSTLSCRRSWGKWPRSETLVVIDPPGKIGSRRRRVFPGARLRKCPLPARGH